MCALRFHMLLRNMVSELEMHRTIAIKQRVQWKKATYTHIHWKREKTMWNKNNRIHLWMHRYMHVCRSFECSQPLHRSHCTRWLCALTTFGLYISIRKSNNVYIILCYEWFVCLLLLGPRFNSIPSLSYWPQAAVVICCQRFCTVDLNFKSSNRSY